MFYHPKPFHIYIVKYTVFWLLCFYHSLSKNASLIFVFCFNSFGTDFVNSLNSTSVLQSFKWIAEIILLLISHWTEISYSSCSRMAFWEIYFWIEQSVPQVTNFRALLWSLKSTLTIHHYFVTYFLSLHKHLSFYITLRTNVV